MSESLLRRSKNRSPSIAIEWGGGKKPDDAALAELHHKAHAACFIANSVTTKVTVEGS